MSFKTICLFTILAAVNSYNWGIHRINHGIKKSNPVNNIIFSIGSKSMERHSVFNSYAVSKSKQFQPRNENIVLKIISKFWSATFGWLISGFVLLVRSILVKSVKKNSSDIDEKIEYIREIAEIEHFDEEVQPADDIISVTVANEFVEELSIPPKAMDKEKLAAARKIVERKLEELKKTASPVAPSNVFTTISSVPETSSPIFSGEVAATEIITPSPASPVVSNALTTTSEAITVTEGDAPVATSQDIRSSFPEVLSEKSDDQTYMTYQVGSVDPYAVYGNDYSKSADEVLGVTAVDSAAKVQAEDTWGKIKAAGKSGLIAYTLTELSFWAIVPILVVAYESINKGTAAFDLADQANQVHCDIHMLSSSCPILMYSTSHINAICIIVSIVRSIPYNWLYNT